MNRLFVFVGLFFVGYFLSMMYVATVAPSFGWIYIFTSAAFGAVMSGLVVYLAGR